jgi:organic hydroperoxide reductase OsmC/OhrA
MSEHRAKIHWKRGEGEFLRGKYSREHTWDFDGGLTVPASSSPSAVPAPWSNPANVDPEEAFVAAIASCHMLTFLWLASKAKFQVDAYEDEAVGEMAKTATGSWWVSTVKLRPRITWAGERTPTAEELEHLHHGAHEQCFIANSVKTQVTVERWPK